MDSSCFSSTSRLERLPELGRLMSDILSSPKAAKTGLANSLKLGLLGSWFLLRRSAKAERNCRPSWLFLLEAEASEQELVCAMKRRLRAIHFRASSSCFSKRSNLVPTTVTYAGSAAIDSASPCPLLRIRWSSGSGRPLQTSLMRCRQAELEGTMRLACVRSRQSRKQTRVSCLQKPSKKGASSGLPISQKCTSCFLSSPTRDGQYQMSELGFVSGSKSLRSSLMTADLPEDLSPTTKTTTLRGSASSCLPRAAICRPVSSHSIDSSISLTSRIIQYLNQPAEAANKGAAVGSAQICRLSITIAQYCLSVLIQMGETLQQALGAHSDPQDELDPRTADSPRDQRVEAVAAKERSGLQMCGQWLFQARSTAVSASTALLALSLLQRLAESGFSCVGRERLVCGVLLLIGSKFNEVRQLRIKQLNRVIGSYLLEEYRNTEGEVLQALDYQVVQEQNIFIRLAKLHAKRTQKVEQIARKAIDQWADAQLEHQSRAAASLSQIPQSLSALQQQLYELQLEAQ